ncbi:MAG: radical SAM family heme chaperone HemW [Ilumatobacteraceae bacterium]
MTDPFGIYIHIPFCSKRCDYCAFATWTDRGHLVDAYMDALVADIEAHVAAGMPVADTVFVGGGTPTLVPPESLVRVIAAIPVSDRAEVTVESNPDDVTVEMMRTYSAAGVNRISIGVQSMVPQVLISLGRTHVPANVERAVAAVREAGITSFNLDLIYGGAGERLVDWERTLRGSLALDPMHISAYALTIEAGTPLATQPERHPDDDDLADKYELADDLLTAAGLANYEVSNWAVPGHECEHNSIYWRQGDYQAFGCAGHSYRRGRRFWNVRTPDRYIDLIARHESVEAAGEELEPEERRIERLQLQLRMRDGVPLSALDGGELEGLVQRRDDRWVLTRRGRLMANEVSLRLR